MQRRTEEAIQQIQEIIADLQSRGEKVSNQRIGELFNDGVSRQRINQILKEHELKSKFCFDRKSYVMKLKSMNIDTSKYTSTELRKLVNYPVSKNFGNLLTDFNIPYVKSLRYNFDGIDTSQFTIKQLMYEIGYEHSEQDFRNMISHRKQRGINTPYKKILNNTKGDKN